MPLSISIQPRDSRFVKLGNNHRYGVIPESISYSGDIGEYGPLGCSFLLKMNPLMPHNDIEQFTPVVINDGTVDVWSGRIIGTPTEYGETGVVHVECHGWGQHTKDDCTGKQWVIADCLSKAEDVRRHPTANLGFYRAAGTVEISDGVALLKYEQNTVVATSQWLGFYIDFGPDPEAWPKVLSWTHQTSANDSQQQWYVANMDVNPDGVYTRTDMPGYAGISLVSYGTPTNFAGTFNTRRRYVTFFVYVSSAHTLNADTWLKVTNLVAYSDSSYYNNISGGTQLNATTAIKETLNLLCHGVSSDRSRIQQTALPLPNFPGSPGFKYANELIEAANAPHGYKFYFTPQAEAVPVFEPQDTDYTFVIGAQDDYKFSDPSRNDGRSVFSKVITEYENTAGESAFEVAGGEIKYNTNENGDFNSSIAGWTVPGSGSNHWIGSNVGGRTGTMQLKGDASNGYSGTQSPLSGPVPIGRLMTQRFKFFRNRVLDPIYTYAIVIGGSSIDWEPGFSSADVGPKMLNAPLGQWVDIEIKWRARKQGGMVGLQVFTRTNGGSPVSSDNAYIDSYELVGPVENIVGWQGFQRTALRPMGTKSTSAIAQSIAQLEFNNSQFPPLKGKLELVGRIRTKQGNSIPVNRLPGMTGKIVLLEQLRDPLTGAMGRQAVIRRAEYNEAEDKVTLELDNDFNFISNLRHRLAM